jgi:hypothetical protein
MPKSTSGAACNPLPSLLRASAWDAGNARMRKAGRSIWTRGDYNEAARTQNRLVRACYGRDGDPENSPLPFIRFGIAERMQRDGVFTLSSKMPAVHAAIDHVLSA